MTTVFLTRWVLTRGILQVEAEIRPPPQGAFLERAWVSFEDEFGCPFLMGRDMFLTLEEARENARIRFARAFKIAEKQYIYMMEANDRMDELLVHQGPITKVKALRSFAWVHSEEEPAVES